MDGPQIHFLDYFTIWALVPSINNHVRVQQPAPLDTPPWNLMPAFIISRMIVWIVSGVFEASASHSGHMSLLVAARAAAQNEHLGPAREGSKGDCIPQ